MISKQRKEIILEKLALTPYRATRDPSGKGFKATPTTWEKVEERRRKAEAAAAAAERKNIRRARPLGGVTLSKKETLPHEREYKQNVRKMFKGVKGENPEHKAALKRIKSRKAGKMMATGLASEYRRISAEKKGLGAYHDVQSGMTRPVEKSRTLEAQDVAENKRTDPLVNYVSKGTKKSK